MIPRKILCVGENPVKFKKTPYAPKNRGCIVFLHQGQINVRCKFKLSVVRKYKSSAIKRRLHIASIFFVGNFLSERLRGYLVPPDFLWGTIGKFLSRLSEGVVIDAILIADQRMTSRRALVRYFCGICNCRIRDQDMAEFGPNCNASQECNSQIEEFENA